MIVREKCITALRMLFGSLEKRLIGALLLIVLCTCVLQLISQDRAYRLRGESENLRATAINVERADQLVDTVRQFRLIAQLYLRSPSASGQAPATDELTDHAVWIDNQINALRMSGMDLYDLPVDIGVFGGMEHHIDAIVVARESPATAASHAAIDQRNGMLVSTALAIQSKASAEHKMAFSRLSHSIENWHLLVSLTGGLTIVVVLVILIDLTSNILPALRRMHAALRRLADGDLDFEIEAFHLLELKALSGSLESFRRNAQAVQNLAFTDPSTGLPNRRAFTERAGAWLAAGCGEDRDGFMIALIDIDRFKHVNDDYGHAAGDSLVKLVGERLADALPDDAIIARVGGDEFAICTSLHGGQSAAALGSELAAAARKPFDLGNFTAAVSISLGLVEIASDEACADLGLLLNRADLALYASKNSGRNRSTCFTEDLEAERELDRALERDLAQAFDRGQLRMVYQPIHSVADEEREVEALVRWHHPVLGDISPSRFIPAAERSGLMVRLGEWIVREALDNLARWPNLTMSINLSPLQLQQDGFVSFLLECCRVNRIAPQRVILEVTESFSIERNSRALLTLTLLRNTGFRIALDDFGTGYSSLCMMKTFKFDRLKLDRSLISDLANDTTSQAVFDAAVTMGLKIGAEVVAEGISEESLVEPVRSAGCTHLQGFLFSRPIEAGAVDAYFREGRSPARKVA